MAGIISQKFVCLRDDPSASFYQHILIGQLSFRFPGNLPHHPDRLNRIFTHRGLRGEHDGIRTVEDSVGDVSYFGAGGTGGEDHRFKHLGGGNYRLAGAVALSDDIFLHQGDFFKRNIDAEVSPGDHDGITDGQNTVEFFHGQFFFNLGDERDIYFTPAQDFSYLHDIFRAINEGNSDIVRRLVCRKIDHLFQTVGYKRRRGAHAGQDDTATGGELPTDDYTACNFGLVHRNDFKLNGTIVNKNPGTHPGIFGKSDDIYRDDVFIAFYLTCGQDYLSAFHQRNGFLLHISDAVFRSRNVHEDSHRARKSRRQFPYHFHAGSVLVKAAVRQIEAGDIHTGFDELPDHGRGIGGRPDGADNPGALPG